MRTNEKNVTDQKRNPRFKLYFVVFAFFCTSTGFAHPITPTLFQNLGLHDYMFGVALAVMMVTNFLMSPFWGKLNDYYSSRYLILIECIGYGLAQLAFAYATTEVTVIIARMAAGIFTGGVFVNNLTYVVNMSEPENRGKHLTISATIQVVFCAFGYLIGGLVGEISIMGTFIMQVVVLCVSGVLFFIVCGNDVPKEASSNITAKQLARDSNPFKAFISCREFITVDFAILFGISMLLNLANIAFDQSFNYYLKAELSLGSAYNGIIKAAVALISLISNVSLCFWIISKTNTLKSIQVIILVSLAFSIAILFPSGISLFIILSIGLYACNSVGIPVLQDTVAAKAKKGQENLVMAFYNSSKSFGGIFGSAFAGFLYQANSRYPFIFAAIVLLMALGMGAALNRRQSQEKEPCLSDI